MTRGARTIGPFRAIEATFTIGVDDARLGDVLQQLFGACADDTPPRHVFTLAGGGPCDLRLDGRLVLTDASPSLALAQLVWEVNRLAQQATRHLLLHAAAAAADGRAVVLSAPSGAGKSTMVTALVRAGLAYVTDEIVALAPGGAITPYPKPIGLDPRGASLFTGLPPDDRLERLADVVRMIPPASIGTVAATGARVDVVLVHRHVPGAVPELVPLHRAEALAALADQSFNVARHTGSLALLAAVVRASACYRLDVGVPAAAAEAVAAALRTPGTVAL